MYKLLDGKTYSQELRLEIKERIIKLKEQTGKDCVLAVVIVGNDPASQIYVRNKVKACEETGIKSISVNMDENSTQQEVENKVLELVNDDSINGILVQLPLPKHLDSDKIISLIPYEKDVDGFSDVNVGKLSKGEEALFSCTPNGIIKLLERNGVELKGKNAVVIGRSNIVGKPISMLLLKNDCTVTVCHSKTNNLAEFTRLADIIVVAIGKAKFLTEDMVKEGAVVVDVGMNRVDGKLYGDVDFDAVAPKCSYITPVPGGVGPMTVTMLMYNTMLSFERKYNGLQK